MDYPIEEITGALRAARQRRGLSQRELSERAGVRQSHISRIESGTVDLRLSSLVALARALELEVTLVPRQAITAVTAVARSTEAGLERPGKGPLLAVRELDRLQKNIAEIDVASAGSPELVRLRRRLRELEHYWSSPVALDALRQMSLVAKKLQTVTTDAASFRETLSRLQALSNAFVHGAAESVADEQVVRPAYSLDEDGDD